MSGTFSEFLDEPVSAWIDSLQEACTTLDPGDFEDLREAWSWIEAEPGLYDRRDFDAFVWQCRDHYVAGLTPSQALVKLVAAGTVPGPEE